MFRYSQKGLKLPSALRDCDPRTAQVREAAEWRIFQDQQLERVVVKYRKNPCLGSRQYVSLGGSQLRMAVFQHVQTLYSSASFEKGDSNFRVMPLDNLFSALRRM